MATAVKGFVIRDGKLLLIRRVSSEKHYPGIWEVPGGRISDDEDLKGGLKREIKEEVGLDVEVIAPLSCHHFVRQDGQEIHMVTFLCKYKGGEVKLGKEHEAYKWVEIERASELIHWKFYGDLGTILTWFRRLCQMNRKE